MASTVRIALAYGDGIGPEVTRAALRVIEAAGAGTHLEFVEVEMGERVFAAGDARGITDEAMATIEACGVVFKGPMATPKGGGGKSINVTLRKIYGAFANLREFRSLPGVETVYSKAGVPVDFYVVRENVEDTYGGIEHRLTPDVVEAKRLITAPGCDQLHRFAFRTAQRLGIPKIHCGHKANIMKMSDGLFLERFREIGRTYPEIETTDVIIDALCMGLVQKPHEYRMVVLTNLQGDIVSDLAAGLVGGLGFASSANIGTHIGIFEAVHGSAPDIAGKGIANPTALILSSLMMLRHLGMLHEAAVIENALLTTLEQGVHTGDFGPRDSAVGTEAFADAIIANLGKAPTTIEPEPVPDAADPVLERPDRPGVNTRMHTFSQVVAHHVGCDIYIETNASPLEMAQQLGRLCENTPFRLTMISNRGTQVWPTGSVYTDIVDYFRVRFELRDRSSAGRYGQAPAIALLARIAERFAIAEIQLLRDFDGVRGYTLAQGQSE